MYIKIIILLAAVSQAVYCAVTPITRFRWPVPIRDILTSGRILSGTNAASGQFPWQVSIEARKSGFISLCGGSLISSNAVLTAAHCVQDFTSFKIDLGSIYLNSPTASRTVDSSKVVIHPQYSSSKLHYDAAIIKLDQDVAFSSTIQPIALPRLSSAVEDLFFDYKITVSGWGRTESGESSSQLKYTDMSVIRNNDCKLYFGTVINESTLCAKGTQNGINGPCNGDSGGPAVAYEDNNWRLIGIISFSANGCQSGAPAGFTNVSFLLSWISATTGIPISTFM